MNRICPSCDTSFPNEAFFCGYCGTITVQEQDPADPDPRLGHTLGQYVVVARVADGAMGRVYEGRHPDTKARMAVKVLHSDVARDEVSVERFKREFETAQSFDHPNIVSVLEFGDTEDGSHFLTMEYLQGEELGDVLRRDGALPPERMIRIVCQTALALDHAHAFGVIHRDLKPDNIFLVESEEGDVVRILDFGSVKLQVEMGPKLTAFGTTLGSPYYMSPEQAMGKLDVDQRSDVFALAAIMYEMSTGQVPFGGEQVAQILMKIMNEEPPPPSTVTNGYPAAFDDVVAKGIRKDKARRYGTTLELAEDMVASFGLKGTVEHWANTPAEDIAAALARATPPAPLPYGQSTPPPAAQVEAKAGDGVQARPAGSSAIPLLLGMAVVGFLVVGGALVAAFLLLT